MNFRQFFSLLLLVGFNVVCLAESYSVIKSNFPVRREGDTFIVDIPDEEAEEIVNKFASDEELPPLTIKNEINNTVIVNNATIAPASPQVSPSPQIEKPKPSATNSTQKTDKLVQKSSQSTQNQPTLSWLQNLSLPAAGKLILGAAAAGYGLTFGKLMLLERSLSQATTWSNWNANIPLDSLLAMPQEDVARDLFDGIKSTYPCARHKDSALDPLVCFMNAIEKESKKLNQLITVHEWIDYLRLSNIFPGQVEALQKADHNLARLDYLKHLATSWASAYSKS